MQRGEIIRKPLPLVIGLSWKIVQQKPPVSRSFVLNRNTYHHSLFLQDKMYGRDTILFSEAAESLSFKDEFG